MSLMISENLRMLRNKSKHSLEEVAEIIGVSRQSVAKWELNETYPDIENCVKLSALYKVSLDALVKAQIEPINNNPNPENQEQYVFGIIKIGDSGEILLPNKAKEVMNISSGDRVLILGDKGKGLAIIKCEGINDFLEKEKE